MGIALAPPKSMNLDNGMDQMKTALYILIASVVISSPPQVFARDADAAPPSGRIQVNEFAYRISGEVTPMIGAQKTFHDAMVTLSSHAENNNIMLLAESGAGKSTFANNLAVKLATQQVETVFVDLNALNGLGNTGDLDAKLAKFFAEAKQNNWVVIIDEVHQIVGVKGQETKSLANKLKVYLLDPQIRFVGMTTLNEYDKHLKEDTTIKRRFNPLKMPPPTAEQAIAILRGKRDVLESKYGVGLPDTVIVKTVELATRYLSAEPLVATTESLLHSSLAELAKRLKTGESEASAEIKVRQQMLELEVKSLQADLAIPERISSPTQKAEYENAIDRAQRELKTLDAQLQNLKGTPNATHEIGQLNAKLTETKQFAQWALAAGDLVEAGRLTRREIPRLEAQIKALSQSQQAAGLSRDLMFKDVAEAASRLSDIPAKIMMGNNAEQIASLEQHLREKVIGHDDVKAQIIQDIKIRNANVAPHKGPELKHLYDGPSGNGKTHMAKQIAVGLGRHLEFISMVEYQSKADLWRLIGSSPGYEGAQDGGVLTEAAKRHPHMVLLLDEIEKAHPDILKALLQLLDDGYMSDGLGRKVDFRNVMVIMTTNASRDYLGLPKDSVRRLEMERLILGEHLKLDGWESMSNNEREKLMVAELEKRAGMVTEFLGRIDKFRFQLLTREQAVQIARLELKARAEYVYKEHGLRVSFSDQFAKDAARKGYDPQYGARSLSEHYKTHVDAELAKIVANESLKRQLRETNTAINFDYRWTRSLSPDGKSVSIQIYYPIEIGKTHIMNVSKAFSEYVLSTESYRARGYGQLGETERNNRKSLRERLIEAGKTIIRAK